MISICIADQNAGTQASYDLYEGEGNHEEQVKVTFREFFDDGDKYHFCWADSVPCCGAIPEAKVFSTICRFYDEQFGPGRWLEKRFHRLPSPSAVCQHHVESPPRENDTSKSISGCTRKRSSHATSDLNTMLKKLKTDYHKASQHSLLEKHEALQSIASLAGDIKTKELEKGSKRTEITALKREINISYIITKTLFQIRAGLKAISSGNILSGDVEQVLVQDLLKFRRSQNGDLGTIFDSFSKKEDTRFYRETLSSAGRVVQTASGYKPTIPLTKDRDPRDITKRNRRYMLLNAVANGLHKHMGAEAWCLFAIFRHSTNLCHHMLSLPDSAKETFTSTVIRELSELDFTVVPGDALVLHTPSVVSLLTCTSYVKTCEFLGLQDIAAENPGIERRLSRIAEHWETTPETDQKTRRVLTAKLKEAMSVPMSKLRQLETTKNTHMGHERHSIALHHSGGQIERVERTRSPDSLSCQSKSRRSTPTDNTDHNCSGEQLHQISGDAREKSGRSANASAGASPAISEDRNLESPIISKPNQIAPAVTGSPGPSPASRSHGRLESAQFTPPNNTPEATSAMPTTFRTSEEFTSEIVSEKERPHSEGGTSAVYGAIGALNSQIAAQPANSLFPTGAGASQEDAWSVDEPSIWLQHDLTTGDAQGLHELVGNELERLENTEAFWNPDWESMDIHPRTFEHIQQF